MSNKPVVRFAPSPTGQVHIGNIRVAIFNWLFARHNLGKFLLRIEDTDSERSTQEATQTIIDTMNWLKLYYDGDVYYQSAHKGKHLINVDKLMAHGDAYTDGDVIKFRIPREATDIPEIHEIKGKKYVVYQDLVKGEMKKPLDDIQDFVIVRSDGSPVFHIANVVDDIIQGITHVIRGDDHVENTFKHILMFRCLGAEVPQYAHLPMIVNADGKPYSKRDGDAFIGDFKNKGFLPDALVNYLALLGWSPKDGTEYLNRAELIFKFELEHCHRSPAKMDMRKLINLNGKYIADMGNYEFFKLCKEYFEFYDEKGDSDWMLDFFSATNNRRVCTLMQSRVKTFEDIKNWSYFFVVPDYEELYKSSNEFVKNFEMLKGGFDEDFDIGIFLDRLEEILSKSCFEPSCLEIAIGYLTEAMYKRKKNSLNQRIRFIVTATDKGAGICETLNLIGKESTLERIGKFRKFYENMPI